MNQKKIDELKELGVNYEKWQQENKNCITHDDYCMYLAYLTSLRSPDPSTQCGACIINTDRRIVGLGYNDFPYRYDGNIDKTFELPLDKDGKNQLNKKYLYIGHAAAHAILHKNSTCLKDCIMYTTTLPCNECFKLIVQSGIKTVYYLQHSKEKWPNDVKESLKGSQVMAIICDIALKKYEIKNERILKFNSNETNALANIFGKEIQITFSKTASNIEIEEKLFYEPEYNYERKDIKPPKIQNLQASGFIDFKPEYNIKPNLKALSAHDYYMCVAFLTSARSIDRNKKVGACIVDKNGKVVACGYNGFPNKADFTWQNPEAKTVNSKHMYVCHAELNAIVNKYDVDLTDCTMYVTLHPCFNCAQLIIQSQIKNIFYFEIDDNKAENREFQAAQILFKKFNINCKKYSPTKTYEIDFKEINLTDYYDEVKSPVDVDD